MQIASPEPIDAVRALRKYSSSGGSSEASVGAAFGGGGTRPKRRSSVTNWELDENPGAPNALTSDEFFSRSRGHARNSSLNRVQKEWRRVPRWVSGGRAPWVCPVLSAVAGGY